MSGTDKRDIIVDCLSTSSPHVRPSADAILNALHQGGWMVVPKGSHVAVDALLSDGAMTAAASVLLRAYDSEFDAAHLAPGNFAEDAADALRAAIDSVTNHE